MTHLLALDVVEYGADELPHSIDVDDLSQLEEDLGWDDTAELLETWCTQQFGKCRFPVAVDDQEPVLYERNQQGSWDLIKGYARFMHERDLMLFKLRWA